jgi:hypothetical protein
MSAFVLLKRIFVRTRLTYVDFAARNGVASIRLTPNYEGTVASRESVFPLLKATT